VATISLGDAAPGIATAPAARAVIVSYANWVRSTGAAILPRQPVLFYQQAL
jgi:hypothetical protein